MLLALFATALAADPDFAAAIDEARVEADLRALCGIDPIETESGPHTLVSRAIQHPDHALARAWLVERFEAIDGLVVRTEPFATDGVPDTANVIAELPGTNPDTAWMIVGAHYDSTGKADEAGWDAATDPAPGCDDDAAGIAALLEVARALAAWEPGFELSVRFVAFDSEEVGLVGSYTHVDALVERGESVQLMLALDPLGYNPAEAYFLWFAYDQRWREEAERFEALAVAEESPLDVIGVDADLIGGDDRSDHFPFWEAGEPALHLGSFPQPPTYHTMADTLDAVDVSYVAEASRLVATHTANVALPHPGDEDEKPKACGCDTASPVPLLAGLLLALGLRWSNRSRCR